MRKVHAVAASFAAAIVGVLALATPATATGYVTPGAFCATPGKVGESKDGDKYVCEKQGDDKVARWYPKKPKPTPTPTAEPTVTPTATPTAEPTGSPEPTPTATAEPTPEPTGSTEPEPTDTAVPPPDVKTPQLPVTGAAVPVLLGTGGALGLAGLGLLWAFRRRFTA